MKRYTIVVLLVMLPSILLQAQWLKTRGPAIVNEQGVPVILRGMGLGGWMLQEGYMFRLSFLGQQYRIREKIKDVVGEEKATQFYDRWLAQHTTRKDVDMLAAWGFNSIRLPMHYDLYTLPVEQEPVAGQDTWLEKGFAYTDSLLQWCKANNIYLILDLHAAPGGQGNDLPISDRDPAKPSLWESEANQKKTIALWRKLAERYANEPWIAGYDIINEPNWGFEDPKDVRGTEEKKNIPLRALMQDITKAIREVDQRHIVIIEGNGFGNNYRGIMPTWDDNMVLSFHKYGNFNTTKQIQQFLQLRDEYKVPLWLGESGENSNTWFTEAIALVESEGIGWAWWQQKKMGINNPQEIVRPDGYDELLAYWSGKGPKPGATAAWKTLEELLENVKAENNIQHPDVVDAMIRQVKEPGTAIPFKQHLLKGQATIQAVDFDMGAQRVAYYDTDSSRYQYTPGVNTDGNRGDVYRNDGVDIRKEGEAYHVFQIEDGEWLQYTIDVQTTGKYNVSFLVRPQSANGKITLMETAKRLGDLGLPAPSEKDKHAWIAVTMKDITLQKGTNRIRVVATKGGFDLSTIQFNQHNQ